jgi:hypothetical protein
MRQLATLASLSFLFLRDESVRIASALSRVHVKHVYLYPLGL